MEDVESGGNSRRRRILVPVLALALASVGCPKTQPMSEPDASCKVHVKRVCIAADGSADPELVQVKKKAEIVVWIAPEGTKLQIDFPTNPFPQPILCPGDRFCASLLPPNGAYNIYNYTATVTTLAATRVSDPRLQVVP